MLRMEKVENVLQEGGQDSSWDRSRNKVITRPEVSFATCFRDLPWDEGEAQVADAFSTWFWRAAQSVGNRCVLTYEQSGSGML